jgi:hypothetical protein
MLTYEELSRKPNAFKSITGITLEEFQMLLAGVEPRYQAAEQKRLARPERKRAPGGGAKPRYLVLERLLMTMVWLRLYLTCEAVGILFGVDKSTASRYTRPILLILRDLGADTLGWPEEAQALVAQGDAPLVSAGDTVPTGTEAASPSSTPTVHPSADLVAIVDASEQRVERSQDNATQKAHYSGKKKAHTRKTQLVANEHGRIRDVSTSVPGAVHDITLFRQSGVIERLPEDITAMGDNGYQGIQDDMPDRSVALPYRASRNHPLTPEQKLHNHEISRIRVVIENTIAALKHFRILADVFRHTIEHYDSIVLAIVGIVNCRIDKRLAGLAAA